MDTDGGNPLPQREGKEEPPAEEGVGMDDGGCSKDEGEPGKGPHPQCMPERAALIKSILNFLKKAIPDATFAAPDPVMKDDRHYKSFAESLGSDTFEEHRPSLQKKAQKDKTLPFYPSVQHVKNTLKIVDLC